MILAYLAAAAFLGLFIFGLFRYLKAGRAMSGDDSEGAVDRSQAFRGAFEEAATPMAFIGTDGRWVQVNQRLLDVLGYARETFLGFSFADLTHPDDRKFEQAQTQRLMSREIRSWSLELRLAHRDGYVVPCRVHATLSLRNTSNQVLMRCVFVPVAELMGSTPAEAGAMTLENVEEIAVIRSDLRGQILAFSKGAELLFGYEASEVLGKPRSIFYQDLDVSEKQPEADVREAVRYGPIDRDVTRVVRDGALFTARSTLSRQPNTEILVETVRQPQLISKITPVVVAAPVSSSDTIDTKQQLEANVRAAADAGSGASRQPAMEVVIETVRQPQIISKVAALVAAPVNPPDTIDSSQQLKEKERAAVDSGQLVAAARARVHELRRELHLRKETEDALREKVAQLQESGARTSEQLAVMARALRTEIDRRKELESIVRESQSVPSGSVRSEDVRAEADGISARPSITTEAPKEPGANADEDTFELEFFDTPLAFESKEPRDAVAPVVQSQSDVSSAVTNEAGSGWTFAAAATADPDSSASEAKRSGLSKDLTVIGPALSEPQVVGAVSRKKRTFHIPACHALIRVAASSRISFGTREEASAEGFLPCGLCFRKSRS